MKRANSKLAALTLITTLAVTSVIATTVHAEEKVTPDQAVAGKHKPITEEQLQRAIGNRNPNNIKIQAKFENTNLKSQGISITGTVKTQPKTPENSSWFWDLWTRFKKYF
ncbi:TPA: hypothetical protein ACHWA6_001410 [Streptococcus suis]|uniref:Uncharacterized protein n=1 Tax=Streptococcus suis TaxID=1307 RepID=A0A0Z8JQ38_STRSU|nr:hypothetical protein [Streptococcus suis]MCK3990190.1 hypothetical protein [Streptococcus suis]MCK4022135.1 hypothetical protein [Streptococcus suis]NQG71356.1 hypothetical protein [Streptococcus suis]NQH62383.1 hypothetical protein [Streptococcus suis]NQJ74839.1 hypothetical protein [Streptococcus suis]